MLIVLEIILTISAWKRGWRWKALIPVAIAVGMGFLGGMMIAASGGTEVNKGAFILIDILLVITQALLVIKAPTVRREQIQSTPIVPQVEQA